jgi:hypothetical protein
MSQRSEDYKNFAELIIALASRACKFGEERVSNFCELILVDAIRIFGEEKANEMCIYNLKDTLHRNISSEKSGDARLGEVNNGD